MEWDARMDEEEAIEAMMESEGAVAQAQGAEEDAARCSSGGGGVGGRDSGGGPAVTWTTVGLLSWRGWRSGGFVGCCATCCMRW